MQSHSSSTSRRTPRRKRCSQAFHKSTTNAAALSPAGSPDHQGNSLPWVSPSRPVAQIFRATALLALLGHLAMRPTLRELVTAIAANLAAEPANGEALATHSLLQLAAERNASVTAAGGGSLACRRRTGPRAPVAGRGGGRGGGRGSFSVAGRGAPQQQKMRGADHRIGQGDWVAQGGDRYNAVGGMGAEASGVQGGSSRGEGWGYCGGRSVDPGDSQPWHDGGSEEEEREGESSEESDSETGGGEESESHLESPEEDERDEPQRHDQERDIPFSMQQGLYQLSAAARF